MTEPPSLIVEDVVAGYGEAIILSGVDLILAPGTLTTIIGANGAGKSTLLRTLAGTVNVRRGSIRFGNRDVTAMSALDRLTAGIGHVPQGRCNFPGLTVTENLSLGAYSRRDGRAAIEADRVALLERFPALSRRANTLAGNLSGGEQQLLETAMVLMTRPHLLLLDEPSLGLSPKMMNAVFESARQLCEDGLTVLVVEQNAIDALRLSDFGVVMELGRVRHVAAASEVLKHPEIKRLILGI